MSHALARLTSSHGVGEESMAVVCRHAGVCSDRPTGGIVGVVCYCFLIIIIVVEVPFHLPGLVSYFTSTPTRFAYFITDGVFVPTMGGFPFQAPLKFANVTRFQRVATSLVSFFVTPVAFWLGPKRVVARFYFHSHAVCSVFLFLQTVHHFGSLKICFLQTVLHFCSPHSAWVVIIYHHSHTVCLFCHRRRGCTIHILLPLPHGLLIF